MHPRAILSPTVGVEIIQLCIFAAQNSTRHSIEFLDLGLKHNRRGFLWEYRNDNMMLIFMGFTF